MNVLAISHPILIRFECSWALFKAGGYRNAYTYPYPSLPVVLTRAGLKTRGVHYYSFSLRLAAIPSHITPRSYLVQDGSQSFCLDIQIVFAANLVSASMFLKNLSMIFVPWAMETIDMSA